MTRWSGHFAFQGRRQSHNNLETMKPLLLFIVAAWCLFPVRGSAHPGSGIVVDAQGNIFVSDINRGLLKFGTDGKVIVVLKEAGHWLALDSSGKFSRMEFEKSDHWPRWFKHRNPADRGWAESIVLAGWPRGVTGLSVPLSSTTSTTMNALTVPDSLFLLCLLNAAAQEAPSVTHSTRAPAPSRPLKNRVLLTQTGFSSDSMLPSLVLDFDCRRCGRARLGAQPGADGLGCGFHPVCTLSRAIRSRL
jgi:hypothetical protein